MVCYFFGGGQYKIHTEKNDTEFQQLTEYGSLQDIVKEYESTLENDKDILTALIKGKYGGMEISIEMYLFHVAVQSAPTNRREFMAKFSNGSNPIRESETITELDLDMLCNPNSR